MSGKRIYRLNIDDYNDTGRSKNVFLKANLQQELINSQDAPDYNVAIEKAEFSISSVPMFVNKGDLKIEFYHHSYSGGALPMLTHTLNGAYMSIPEFIDDLNSKMSYYTSTPTPELRSFGLFSYDPETELITHTMTAQEISEWYFNEIQVKFSGPLQFLLDFGLLSPSGYLDGFKEDGLDSVRTQKRSSRSRFYQMKAIRIYSPSLNTNPYFVYDQNTSTLVQTNMLSEIILNSEFMDSGNINVIYIPTQFRFSEIISSGINVQNIIIYATVHYATGEDIPLVCLPGEYTSLTLVFEKVL